MPGNSKIMHCGILLNMVIERVSSYNATDKMTIYETPLTSMFEFGGSGFGVEESIFILELWVLAFCHWCFVPRSRENDGTIDTAVK